MFVFPCCLAPGTKGQRRKMLVAFGTTCVCVCPLSLCLQFEVNRPVVIQILSLSLSAQTLFSPEPPDLHLSVPLFYFFSQFISLPPCFYIFIISSGVALPSLTSLLMHRP